MTNKTAFCNLYESCSDLQLTGLCCPTASGIYLGCCNLKYSKSEKYLHVLYEKVRALRANKSLDEKIMSQIFVEVQTKYPKEWLILLELFELTYRKKINLAEKIHLQLSKLKENKDLDQLICDGLDLIKKQ